MFVVTASRDTHDRICRLSARGHSGFAEEGSDIVCAAVSTLMQSLHVGLSDVLKIDVTQRSDPKIPEMTIEWDASNDSGQQLARTILLSLKAVANSYPEYVSVLEEDIHHD